MNKYAAAIFATVFAGSVGASESYNDLTRGNPDSYVSPDAGSEFSGMQPGIGDSLNRYHGWDHGNPDLFKSDPGNYAGTDDPDIYGSLGGSPDIDF